MARRIHPLELILRPHGTAELVNARKEVLWASDSDDDFKEDFDDFLDDDDFDDVLDWIENHSLISGEEYDKFDTGEWEMTVETLEDSVNEPIEGEFEELDDDD